MSLLVLVVLMGEAGSPATQSMVATLREALGPNVTVTVEERPDLDEERPIAEGTREAVLRWDLPHTFATVSLRGLEDPAARSVTFARDDDARERGRTLAFVVLSMLPEPVAPRPPQAPPPPEPPPPAPEASPRQPAAVAVRAPVRPPSPPVATLSALGAASFGLVDDGATTAFGGGIAVAWLPVRRLALAVRVEARGGRLGSAQATTLWTAGKLGASWTFVLAPPLSLDLRADLGVGREAVTHYSEDDDQPVESPIWTMLADAWLEAAISLRSSIAVLIGVGADATFTSTDVIVAGSREATLGWLRPMVELGLRASL